MGIHSSFMKEAEYNYFNIMQRNILNKYHLPKSIFLMQMWKEWEKHNHNIDSMQCVTRLGSKI